MAMIIDKINYVTDVPVFSSLGEKEEIILAESACRKSFPAGSFICQEGDRVQFLAVISSGRASSILISEAGNEVILDFYLPGDTIGELNLSENLLQMSNIVSLEPVEVLFIGRQALLKLITMNGQLAVDLADISTKRMQHLHKRLRSIALEGGPQRILSFLTDLAFRFGRDEGDGASIDWNISHQMIASSCGLTRETVSRLIRDLTKKDLLIRKDSGWRVTEEGLDQI